MEKDLRKLRAVHREIADCRRCPKMAGTPVHGPAVHSRIFLLGQAPGVHEASRGRPFAHTAGKTLFRWFDKECGVPEPRFRENVYMAAVARCFPGKAAKGGGDRLPDAHEIRSCGSHLEREIAILKPELLLAVGRLAISEVLAAERGDAPFVLAEVVGQKFRARFRGAECDVVCLPHPSGLSAWHKTEPGRTLLRKALKLVREQPAWKAQFRVPSTVEGASLRD
jgi:uracil-DNA glycosylase